MSNSNAAAQQTPPQGALPSSDPQPGALATPPAPAPDAAPRGLNDSGLRFVEGPGVEPWMVGKTATEVARLAKDMYAALQRGTPAPAPAPRPAGPAAAGAGVNANLVYSDPAAYTEAVLAEATRRAEENLRNAGSAFVTPLASMARQHAQAHRPDVWKHYGPEIESTIATLPPEARGDVSTWQRVIDFVASQHIDEIAERRARDIVARGSDPGVLGSGGAVIPGSGASLSPVRKLFADNHPAVAVFKDEGLDANAVIAHGAKMGHPEDKWAAMLTRKTVAASR